MFYKKKIKPMNESRGTHVPHSIIQPPPKPYHQEHKPEKEMTTYNLLILDKMIQHHYESTEVIRPSQEEVEDALADIALEIQRLKEEKAELLITLNGIQNVMKGSPVVTEFDMVEMIHKIQKITFLGLNKVKS
jgi:uncharacterized protein (DUF305 family)